MRLKIIWIFLLIMTLGMNSSAGIQISADLMTNKSPTSSTSPDTDDCPDESIIIRPLDSDTWKMYLPQLIKWRGDCLDHDPDQILLYLGSCFSTIIQKIIVSDSTLDSTLNIYYWKPHNVYPGYYRVYLKDNNQKIYQSQCFELKVR